MAKHTLGLASLKIGAVAGDGGMGTSLTAIGDTVPGTAIFSNEEGTTTDFFSEEADVPIESVESEPGTTTLVWSTYNLDADAMVALFGGTKSSGPPVTYVPPDTIADIVGSIEVTDKKGNKLEIVRANIKAKKSINFNKTALGQIDVVATVLVPTKAATKPWTLTYAS